MSINRSADDSTIPVAIVLEGISEKWQMNVLQLRGLVGSARVSVDGHGTIEAPAILLTPDQARHLACQITELLGEEGKSYSSRLVAF